MLTNYFEEAMRAANYAILPDDHSYYGEIPGFQGVYANAPTLESCREQLREVLEKWALFRVSERLPLPAINGIEINIQKAA